MNMMQAEFDKLDAPQMAQTTSRMTRWIIRLFGRRLNREIFSRVCNRAYERGVINSHQLHEIHHQFDPTQDGLIGFLYR